MPVECSFYAFSIFCCTVSEVTDTTGYYNFSKATIIIIHTQLLYS